MRADHAATRTDAHEADDLAVARIRAAHEHDRALAGDRVLDHVATTGARDVERAGHVRIFGPRAGADQSRQPASTGADSRTLRSKSRGEHPFASLDLYRGGHR